MFIHRPLNGPFWRGRFPPWRGARKLLISVNGAFPLLNGPFSYLNRPSVSVFPVENSPGKQPIEKRGIKMFLIYAVALALFFLGLVAPYRAILRYYRCDTPHRVILFKGAWHSPKVVRYPPLALSFTKAHLCDTPFCNISRDDCAIPH